MELPQFPTGRLLSTLNLPSDLVAKLNSAGYETTSDLAVTSEEELRNDLHLNQVLPAVLLSFLARSSHRAFAVPTDPVTSQIPASQILSRSLAAHCTTSGTIPDSTSASALLAKPRTYPIPCNKINALLSSGSTIFRTNDIASTPPNPGLRSSYVLEISGPPGSGKACFAMEFVRAAVNQKEKVLVADCQNSLTPGRIYDALSVDTASEHQDHPSKLVTYTKLPTLAHLMAFIHTLPQYLKKTQIHVIIFSCMSLVFQPTESFLLTRPEKIRLMGQIKQVLTRACLENGVTIVITSQLSTHLVGWDNSPANFDTGAKAVLSSQFDHNMFTASRSYRLVLSRNTFGVRHAHLTASPAMSSSLTSKLGTQKPISRPEAADDAKQVAFAIDSEGRIRDV